MLTTEQKQRLSVLSEDCPNLALSFTTQGFTLAYNNVHFIFNDDDIENTSKTLRIFNYVLQGMFAASKPEIRAELKPMIELFKCLNAYKSHI